MAIRYDDYMKSKTIESQVNNVYNSRRAMCPAGFSC